MLRGAGERGASDAGEQEEEQEEEEECRRDVLVSQPERLRLFSTNPAGGRHVYFIYHQSAYFIHLFTPSATESRHHPNHSGVNSNILSIHVNQIISIYF